ncbi:hypothetical protein ABS71_09500 [bacterium SCN 62-11]|nr:prepilin-type N-terminal cleavage/methylation domain-containing protein [Candidatus Eremiobacteraeota bacterium]ODT68692.1 MAG: hypothetical protein ABS71_09500 [bacterium SCN 62-11]
MTPRRAFTLVEIIVVLCLMGILIVPVGTVMEVGYRHFTTLSRQADAKTECQHASELIFGWLAQHPKYRIDTDNHGIDGGAGARLRWQDQKLRLEGKSLLDWPVRDFSVTPRPGGGITLNLEAEVLLDSRRPLMRMHEIYDYPRVGPW